MKPLSLSLNSALLLTTMLFAPSLAMAQDNPQAAETTAEADEDAFAEDDVESDEVVVLGRFIPEPMRETSEVAAFLSAEDLARQGDDTAASALTRLTGLSVVSGRFVYVRGLGDRYSSALLNGSPLPSPEPLRRTVPLDLFPSNILDSAAVQKTYSPNFSADFGGGVIDLKTVGVPADPFFNVKVGVSGDDETTARHGLYYYGGDYDWTGYDDGTRDLPSEIGRLVAANRPFNTFTGAEVEAAGESLVNSPLSVIQTEDIAPNFESEIEGGTSWQFGKYNVGVIGVAGYNNDWTTRRARFGRFGDTPSTVRGERVSTTWDITVNALGGVTVGWDEHEVKGTILYVHNTSKEAQITDEIDQSSGDNHFLKQETGWYERELITGQLAGEHRFGDLELNWRTSAAQSTRDTPYNRFARYNILDNDTAFAPKGTIFYRDCGNANRISFSELTDEIVSGGIDGTYTVALSETRDAKFSAGYDYAHTVRNYSSLDLSFTQGSGLPLVNPNTGLISDFAVARVDYLFSPDNIYPDGFSLRVQNETNVGYKGDLLVNAAYAAADIELIPLLRAALGIRYEDASQRVSNVSRFGATATIPTRLEEAYWLPAATLTWNFAEDLQLRLGYSQTIARPQFRELGGSTYIDPETERSYRGNPLLVDSELTNYDARLEYYFGRNKFVTGGLFYKDIQKPIEEVFLSTGAGVTSFYNAPSALVYGVELEYRTNFTMPIDHAFFNGKDWLFSVNYTFTESEVQASEDDMVLDPSTLAPNSARNLVQDGSQLQGMSPNIVNLQFGYQTEVEQLTLLVGWVDERILVRNFDGAAGIDASIYEKPGINLDLVYRRDITALGQDFTLGVSGRNLLGEDHEEYQTIGGLRDDLNTYNRGTSVSLSLTAKY